jgi:hypothetical protein
MRKTIFLGAAMLALATGTAASAQHVGDWVLGRWHGGPYWFPGVIAALHGDQVTIRYDDGTSETRSLSEARPYNWHVGSHITSRWTDGRWYGASITAMDPGGLTISVRYDDGDTQITNTGRCREE